MKKIILLITALALVCVGCDKQDQTQIVPLESRSQEQTTNQQRLHLDYNEIQSSELKQKSSAPDWYLLGTASGNTYYVDLSKEVVSGSLWAAPAFVIDENGVKAFGKMAINCANQTYKARFGNQEIDWSEIGEGSPVGDFVENVCK